MEITEISIRLRPERKLKAFVNVTFDNIFAVKGLKVIQSKDGLILCMPSRKSDDGSTRDIAHPICKDFRAQLEREIFGEYERVAGRAGRAENAPLDDDDDDDYNDTDDDDE
ncbi:transcriptional regulator [candidate division KSB1 bacterium]|nr:transcriptional regulator [candidate division KSB1 bacterium]